MGKERRGRRHETGECSHKIHALTEAAQTRVVAVLEFPAGSAVAVAVAVAAGGRYVWNDDSAAKWNRQSGLVLAG